MEYVGNMRMGGMKKHPLVAVFRLDAAKDFLR